MHVHKFMHVCVCVCSGACVCMCMCVYPCLRGYKCGIRRSCIIGYISSAAFQFQFIALAINTFDGCCSSKMRHQLSTKKSKVHT